jgi:predicted nucleic acid-binding protein
LTPQTAWAQTRDWLAAEPVWVPKPTDRHAAILGDLVDRHRPTDNLITDAHLAALAIEHRLELYSADSDFAGFEQVRWRNPLRE